MINIKIDVEVNAPIDKVWAAWTNETDITNWNFASEDWSCPKATNNLAVGEKFNYRMEAKDGSMGFDFIGEYKKIEKNKLIEYVLEDNRKVSVIFSSNGENSKIEEVFEAEDENSSEMQRQGWQAILFNFKKHVESK
ncbi:SRPBCC family protein [Bacteriovoracaceae bacterium]|nr:SRPBCC family protein [Bacteriovoracaceae bacterium]